MKKIDANPQGFLSELGKLLAEEKEKKAKENLDEKTKLEQKFGIETVAPTTLGEFFSQIAQVKEEIVESQKEEKNKFLKKYKIESIVPEELFGRLLQAKEDLEQELKEEIEKVEAQPIVEEPTLVYVADVGEKPTAEELAEIAAHVEEPKPKTIVDQVVAKITQQQENTNLFTDPQPEKTNPSIKAIQDKLKSLEQWMGKISMAGPGSGSYWLNDLGDTDKTSLKNATEGQVLTYNETTKKWYAADATGGGGGPSIDSTARSTATAAFLQANTALSTGYFANTAWDVANSAYNKANTANVTAQAAFDYANTITSSTLSGTTLKSSIVNSSLTSVGSLTGLTVQSPIGGNFINLSSESRPGSGTQTWKFWTNIDIGGPDSWIEFPDGSHQLTAFTGSAIDQTARTTSNAAFDKANTVVSMNVDNTTISLTTGGQAQINPYGYVWMYQPAASGGSSPIRLFGYNSDHIELSVNSDREKNSLISVAYGNLNYAPMSYYSSMANIVVGSLFNTMTYSFSNNGILFPDSTNQTTAFTGIAIDQTSRNTSNTAWTTANAAFLKANSANVLAQAAFDYANTISGSTGVDAWARTQANTALSTGYNANTAWTTANAAFLKANVALSRADDAYGVANNSTDIALMAWQQANTGTSLAQSAYNYANGFSTSSLSNNSYTLTYSTNGQLEFVDELLFRTYSTEMEIWLDETVRIGPGGQINGKWLSVGSPYPGTSTGNVTVGDNITTWNPTLNVEFSLSSAKFILDKDGKLTVPVEINFNGTESISSDNNLLHLVGGTNGVSRIDLNAGTNTTSIISNTHSWVFADDGSLIFPDSSVQTTAFTGTAIDQYARNTSNTAWTTANAAFLKANSANVLTQSSFDKANTALSTGYNANTAWTTANAAFLKANSANVLAQSSFDTGNTSFIHANSAYNLANTAITTAGGQTISGSLTANAVTAFIAGPSANSGVALQMPFEGALRNITNGTNTMYFDVSNGGSAHGNFNFRSSSNFTSLLHLGSTQATFGSGMAISGQTPYVGRTSFNVALDTEITVDNIKYRISNQGGVFPQIASASGSTCDVCYDVLGVVSGVGTANAENAGYILLANGTWLSIYSSHGMDSRGDRLTAHITDKNAGKIYRATFMKTNNSNNTDGYNIIVERII